MIRLRRIGYLLRTADYFFGDSARRDAETEQPVWIGHATDSIGYPSGTVASRKDFVTAMRGISSGGIPFNAIMRRDRIPGYDLIVAAPKSISIAVHCLDPGYANAVNHANLDAADQSFQFAECFAEGRRSSFPREVPTQSLAAVRIPHPDSRDNVPHAHVHFLIVNFTEGPGYRGALAARPLFRSVEAIDQFYKHALRTNLHDLGIPVRESANGPEIAAVSRKLILSYSDGKRRIDAAERALPLPDDAPLNRGEWRQILNDRTRPDKVPLEKRPLLYGLFAPEHRLRVQSSLPLVSALADRSAGIAARAKAPRAINGSRGKTIREAIGFIRSQFLTVIRGSQLTESDGSLGDNPKYKPRTKLAGLPKLAIEVLMRYRDLHARDLLVALRHVLRDPHAATRPLPNARLHDEIELRRRRLRAIRLKRERAKQTNLPAAVILPVDKQSAGRRIG